MSYISPYEFEYTAGELVPSIGGLLYLPLPAIIMPSSRTPTRAEKGKGVATASPRIPAQRVAKCGTPSSSSQLLTTL